MTLQLGLPNQFVAICDHCSSKMEIEFVRIIPEAEHYTAYLTVKACENCPGEARKPKQ